jgi:glycine dehydrogenase subunit 1
MSETISRAFPYLPHTEADRQAMLKSIGVRAFEELIEQIPQAVRAGELEIPSGLSELELKEYVAALAAKNKPASTQRCFLGGGSYRRFVPAAVPAIVSRSEFATAYTPYQPEVSQGSLQAIYEFQTAVCLLTGMEVANASMYDGPSACAEAALMAARLTGRNKILLSDSVNPEYRLVTETYARSCGLALGQLAAAGGITGKIAADSDCAAVIVQHPNYFGCLEDLSAIAEETHKHGALLIVVTDPIALGLLMPPGDFGADIVVGDAQPCGNFLSFGGPSAGYMATRQQFVRQLPGRLSGMTIDNRGQRAFTLTLQTREQHIRRAKATSNICTNQALNALTMLVYLTLMGPQGLREVAEVSVRRAHHLAEKLATIEGVKLRFNNPYFSEFLIDTPLPPSAVLDELAGKNILGGLTLDRFYPELKNSILVSVTELNSPCELDEYAIELSEIVAKKRSSSSACISVGA